MPTENRIKTIQKSITHSKVLSCVECWEIGKPFREIMEEVENRLNNEIDNIDKEWRNIAIDNRKKKLGIKNEK